MATVTIVVTYTPISGVLNEAKVTSFTYGGTAYASLTGAQLGNARAIVDQLPKVIEGGSDATGKAIYSAQGSVQPTS